MRSFLAGLVLASMMNVALVAIALFWVVREFMRGYRGGSPTRKSRAN